jgi:CheY-like chemotaxis protein
MARILLVEDDVALLYAVARFLTAAGCEVAACDGPFEALQELESERPVDLLVTDIGLAEGVPHGFSLGRMAKMRRTNLPIIFITGFLEIAEQDPTPPGPVVSKPFELEQLAALIAQQLSGSNRNP